MSTNSFLSTTRDYQAALFFAGDGYIQGSYLFVIYEISLHTTVTHSVPFTGIEYKSIYKDEDEVLFSISAVFRIGKTEQIDDRLWKIKLTLTPANEELWTMFTEHLRT